MFQNLNRDARMVPRQDMVAPSLLPGHTGKRIGRDLTPKHRGAARGVGRVSGAPEDAWGCVIQKDITPHLWNKTQLQIQLHLQGNMYFYNGCF